MIEENEKDQGDCTIVAALRFSRFLPGGEKKKIANEMEVREGFCLLGGLGWLGSRSHRHATSR